MVTAVPSHTPTRFFAIRVPPDDALVLVRVRDHLALVGTLARQLQRQVTRRIAYDDLVSFGNEGLLLAARNFDVSRGIPFRCWATLRIRGAMIDGMRRTGGLPRRAYRALRAMEKASVADEGFLESGCAAKAASQSDADTRLTTYIAGLATALAMGYVVTGPRDEAMAAAGEQPTPEEALAREEVASHLHEAIERLHEPERHIVRRFYLADVTIEDAAREIGKSRSWGSRLHTRALERMARQLTMAGIGRTASAPRACHR
jgi:RNA polymerase sigma factor for flagellar operon FliA